MGANEKIWCKKNEKKSERNLPCCDVSDVIGSELG